jgi:hypothetical protein
VFSPGVPAVFLANYEAAVGFLEGLERRCTLRADVEAFRASAAVEGFLKRWKLSVYFSLRFQACAGAILTPSLAPVCCIVINSLSLHCG